MTKLILRTWFTAVWSLSLSSTSVLVFCRYSCLDFSAALYLDSHSLEFARASFKRHSLSPFSELMVEYSDIYYHSHIGTVLIRFKATLLKSEVATFGG